MAAIAGRKAGRLGRRIVFAILVIVAVWYAAPGAVVSGRFYRQAHVPSPDTTELKRFTDALPSPASGATINEGLPHNFFHPETFLTAVWTTPLVIEHDSPFREYAPSAATPDGRAMLALLGDPANYRPYGGPKLCGGYHPDFML